MEKILIADDVPANIKMLGEILKDRYEIVVATNGERALKLANDCVPDLILLDVMMPGLDGFAACERLKASARTADIPVIFITASNTEQDIVRGFTVGGVDYITKPFNPTELNARVRTHLELKLSRETLKRHSMELESINNELKEKNVLLGKALEQITLLARTDNLTGLWNRRFMMEKLKEEEIRFKRCKRPFSLVMGDIDHFKEFNDTYGHECGDRVLCAISAILRRSIREQDVVSRWGGEEFLLLLPETGISEALIVARRIRERVASNVLHYDGAPLKVTMTLGASAYDQQTGIPGSIRNADEALYLGKSQGRNRVVEFGGRS